MTIPLSSCLSCVFNETVLKEKWPKSALLKPVTLMMGLKKEKKKSCIKVIKAM